MKFTKKISVFFILFANIILLAHSFIPHHHNNCQVSFEFSHIETDECSKEHNHEHDGKNHSGNCVLKQSVFITSNLAKHESKCLDCSKNYFPTDDFQAILVSNELNSILSKNILNKQIISETFSYKTISKSAIGLRAPPTV